ncbi:hypothetical protein SHIRM173S_05609 [Streptomyces hirsutus]
MRSYPSKKQVAQFMERTVQPALADVVREFGKQGYQATLDLVPNELTGISSHALGVMIPEHRDFHYQVQALEAPVPMFGGRMSRQTDVYYRVEVFTQTGSEGYDLMGLSHQQVIDDVLDRYEAHLGFLAYSTEHDYASVLTPPSMTATGAIPVVVPREAAGRRQHGHGGQRAEGVGAVPAAAGARAARCAAPPLRRAVTSRRRHSGTPSVERLRETRVPPRGHRRVHGRRRAGGGWGQGLGLPAGSLGKLPTARSAAGFPPVRQAGGTGARSPRRTPPPGRRPRRRGMPRRAPAVHVHCPAFGVLLSPSAGRPPPPSPKSAFRPPPL